MNTADPLIDVAGLGKAYGRRSVVRNVTLRLARGAIVGLVGANGGGKTTTLRMLARLIRPDEGGGAVLGHDLRERNAPRGAIGYMPQRLSLYPELTVAENLRFRAEVHGLDTAARRIGDVLDRWELGAFADTRFERLSGGWARRAQFAATMLPAPALLLLDEPTAGLDIVTRNRIWSALTDYAAQGCGIVISTHDLAEAERCPVILHYADGTAQGPIAPAELLAQSGTATLEAAVAVLASGTRS